MRTKYFVIIATALGLSACAQPRSASPSSNQPATESLALERAQPFAFAKASAGKTELHFINVAQGDSTLIVCPNGNRILIDAGNLPRTKPRTNAVVARGSEYIRQHLGGKKLHHLVVTHADQDHYNFLDIALEGVTIDNITIGGTQSDFNSEFRSWISSKRNEGSDVFYPKSGFRDPTDRPNTRFQCGATRIYIIAANISGGSSPKNAQSIVLKLTHGTFDAILTGDATRTTESSVISSYPSDWLDVELLKLGHHGSSATSTGAAWADTVKPEISVVSAGANNSYGHPAEVVVERVAPYADSAPHHTLKVWDGQDDPKVRSNYTKAIYSTANSGDIVVSTNGSTYQVDFPD
jgi:competence protein ComEC